MSALILIASIAVTTLCIGDLARVNAKRRRVLGLPELAGWRLVWPKRIVLFAPGVLLLWLGDVSGFVIWLGAASVLGWILAALPPFRAAPSRRDAEA